MKAKIESSKPNQHYLKIQAQQTFIQPITETTNIPNQINNSQIQVNKTQNMKYVERKRKPIPFS